MRVNSLAFRLVAAASLWSALALILAGFVLTSLYRQNAERAFDDRLHVYLNTLIGSVAAQPPGAPVGDPGNLGEQQFETLFSGWYWQIRDSGDGQVLRASASLFSDTLDIANAVASHDEDGVVSGVLAGPDNQTLRVLSQRVTFDDGARRYDILVAGDVTELERQIAEFRLTVALILGVFGIGIVLATATQIRWGLRPLDRIRRSLADLRSGKQTRIDEAALPGEIAPLVAELNALLASNQDVITRARTQVGNLAHALKTPLSVIVNEARANPTPFANKVAEQAAMMRTQVNHYLDRARIAGQVNVIGVVTDVGPAVARLVRAMRRIHGDRGIEIDFAEPQNLRFKGEQQDLEEIVGNLVDNACKWTRSRVVVAAVHVPDSGEGDPLRLRISIDDDGPGLADAEMAAATERGRRLDESKPGSGLGLSIVTDLVAMYEGTFRLSRSSLGGLHAEVTLPAA